MDWLLQRPKPGLPPPLAHVKQLRGGDRLTAPTEAQLALQKREMRDLGIVLAPDVAEHTNKDALRELKIGGPLTFPPMERDGNSLDYTATDPAYVEGELCIGSSECQEP